MIEGWDPSHFPPGSPRRRPTPARPPRWRTLGAGGGTEGDREDRKHRGREGKESTAKTKKGDKDGEKKK